ncbi:FAD-binding domain-containing protein [Favolaschia claudopus]|uniref:FAD-binding domain-containing protein n=1 Tax=Favolaschia claudopus TaxID=2862362 RepID=A0AAW0AU33_9AGAR
MPPKFTAAIQAFKADKIPVFERGEEEYERSVATPNLLYRFARPDFVLQPETEKHVVAIIQQARRLKLQLTIKCGGHSYAGHSTAFEGTLINDREDGYVINGGRCPFVGVGGFILGGGLGPFSRSIGMGSDTVQEISIVTADGELVTVKDTDDRQSPKGRLFWALCGAGGGNFGVVVEMKLAVKQLLAPGGVIVAGRYQWFAGKDEPDLFEQDDFMSTMHDFYTTDWPERMTIDSTWICDLRLPSGNGVRFLTYFDGDKEDFDATIDKYIKHTTLVTQLKRRSLPEKTTRFLHETLVAQWSEETVKAFPTNKSYSIYSSFVFSNDRSTIESVTELIRKKAAAFRKAFPGERVEFLATFIHAGGKMTMYHMYLTLEWEDKWMERDMRAFLRDAKEDLRPLSLNGMAAFRMYWGDNQDELRRIKKKWDKDNFFQSDQGVRLPGSKDGGKGDKDQGDNGKGDKGKGDKGKDKGKDEGKDTLDQGDDEDLTDSLAGKQWEVYETKDIVADLQELADLGF